MKAGCSSSVREEWRHPETVRSYFGLCEVHLNAGEPFTAVHCWLFQGSALLVCLTNTKYMQKEEEMGI